MNILREKTIIVTGGSHGIGLCIGKKCAEEGARLVIIARNKNDLQKTQNEINNISGEDHLIYSLDVSDYAAVKLFKDWLIREKINVTDLVNCAGVMGPIGNTVKVDMEKFTDTININFLGTVYMCSTIAPIMVSNNIKNIINYSGGGAASPFKNYSAYASSKIAIVRFTENLSLELDYSEYNVNCVAPGFVATRIHQNTISAGPSHAGSDYYQKTLNQIKEGSVSPNIAANLTTFLLSSDSDGINGKLISAPWDDWKDSFFQKKLINEKNFATLRRIDEKYFKELDNND